MIKLSSFKISFKSFLKQNYQTLKSMYLKYSVKDNLLFQ